MIGNDKSAFPCLEAWKEEADLDCPDRGMTLRDYFAGQALANFAFMGIDSVSGEMYGAEEIAKRAYNIADTMLAEREKS